MRTMCTYFNGLLFAFCVNRLLDLSSIRFADGFVIRHSYAQSHSRPFPQRHPELFRVSRTIGRKASSDDGSDHDLPVNQIPGSDDDASGEDSDDDFIFIPTKVPTEDSPYWELGNSFEQFLNQCTIQTFMFLLKACRDPQTILWVEEFTQPTITAQRIPGNASQALQTGGSGNSKLLSYHGLGAMNTTAFPDWDSYFRILLEQKQEMYIIESWGDHVPSYEMEINPASLCTRMISVREQICSELTKDLKVVATMGGDTLMKYWQRDAPSDPLRSAGAASLYFLEFNADEDSDLHPSPLRKGNFDLVVLLATQESIHRILNDNQDSDVLSKSDRSFLSNFYLNRLVSHFTGRQRYNRADEFVQELLASSPSVSDEEALVDPTLIAEHILESRQAVAEEWFALVANIQDTHMDIKRLQLDLLMKSYDKTEGAFE